MTKVTLSHSDVRLFCYELAKKLQADKAPQFDYALYPVPRGGVPVAYLLCHMLGGVIVDKPEDATHIIDDIIDSGATRDRYAALFPGKPFHAIVDKTAGAFRNVSWVAFPWEGGEKEEAGIEDNIRRVLQFIGEDVGREGLLETPGRVARAIAHWYRGYNQDPADVFKAFQDGAEGCDEMVVVENIPFFSHCEHHMAPIFGTATIGYIPNGRIIGLSKLPRLLEIFARRLQVQERLTNQIATALVEHLEPLGCGVVVKARHFCMESRGIEKIGSSTVTSALRGVFKTDPSTRSEFLALARKG